MSKVSSNKYTGLAPPRITAVYNNLPDKLNKSLQYHFGNFDDRWPTIARTFKLRVGNFVHKQKSFVNALTAVHEILLDGNVYEDEMKLLLGMLDVLCRLFRMLRVQEDGDVFVEGRDFPFECTSVLFENVRLISVAENFYHHTGVAFFDLGLDEPLAEILTHTRKLQSYIFMLFKRAIPGYEFKLWAGRNRKSGQGIDIKVEGVEGMERAVSVPGREWETIPKFSSVQAWKKIFSAHLCPPVIVIHMAIRGGDGISKKGKRNALNPYKKAAKKPFNLKVSNLSPNKERKIVVNPYNKTAKKQPFKPRKKVRFGTSG